MDVNDFEDPDGSGLDELIDELPPPSPFPPERHIANDPSPTTSPLPALTLYNGTIKADNLAELSVKAVYEKWVEELNSGHLTEEMTLSMLREYWLRLVPYVYRLEANQDCLAPFRDVGPLEEKYLIEPLSYFLSGGNCGAETIVEYLVASDLPPVVCGKVFQVGEATYSCRQCGMDPTCVLCADCFKNSEHKHHKYKIATSSGGGYCDCGDPEAWKAFVHCSTHAPITHDNAAPDKDEALEKRARLLIPCLLLYGFELTATELERNLPDILTEGDGKEQEASDLFCTVLYNDETHTFDLVIQTLTRALQCQKKDAVEYATTIDREGRSMVKVGGFQPCHEVQKIIERSTMGRGPHTKPLKCSVMRREVIQHQTFALRLLGWIESLCTYSVSIRKVIQDVFYYKGEKVLTYSPRNPWLVDAVLLNDTKLWKAARNCWHRLIITGLLKEYDSKKTFAEVFTREYTSIMDDFIRDDHDHAYSVSSLSVQIYTVPSIAHYLVESHDVIYTILRVLLAQCTARVNAAGKLEFDRGAVISTTSFKRTNFAILDLKYVLTNPPADGQWSDKMIKNFTHGIDSFLKFLSFMQEMDSVVRQVGQHMEYEPEWESAFNLHIKLQPVVQLSLEWCGLHKHVFTRAFRHCLHDLGKSYGSLKSKTVTLELANHSATCYVYDVASMPISVHLPLTRFFAGLYLHLPKFNLDFFSSEFNLTQSEKPLPEMIMEPALRLQVLVSQVNASMWKRNGYALLNQLYFYHNVRCRADMLDRDIVVLQIAASVIESNEFLLHVVNRYGLYQWILSGFDEKTLKPEGPEEDINKFLGNLTEDFLAFLITLVSSRFTPEVGQVSKFETIKKEIIQQLCIEPMTHSMLNKSLVENVNMETGLELVVHEVANQKGPTPQRTSVVYELKPEFYNHYDVFHFHYTREEMSKAEEAQRTRKRAAKEPEIFPPPKLPPFTPMFDMLVNFLQCDVFLHIIALVLTKSLKKSCRTISESIIRKTLHLVGLGLNEEISRNHNESGHFFQFSHNAGRWKIFEILDKMLKESALAQHHQMIIWLKRQYGIIKPEMALEEHVIVTIEEEEKQKKAAKVREAKEKMMAKMAAAQQKFMAVNKELFSSADTEGSEDLDVVSDAEMTAVESVAVGPAQQMPSHVPDEKFICILCQEEQSLSIGSKRFVLACFVQRSTVLSQYREKLIEESTVEFQNHRGNELPQIEAQNPLYINPNLNNGTVMTTCGHIMHENCWSSHMDTVVSKERRRPYRLRHPLSFDVDKMEWLCPMCETICNAALPMAVHLPKMYPPTSHQWIPTQEISTPFDDSTANSFDVWMMGMHTVLQRKTPLDKMAVTDEYEAWAKLKWEKPEENIMYSLTSDQVPKVVAHMCENAGSHFAKLHPVRIFSDTDPTYKWLHAGFHSSFTTFMTRNYNAAFNLELPREDDFRMLLAMWNCLAFTIIASETYHREQNLPFFGEDVPVRRSIGMKYLARACGVACDRQGFWTEYSRSFAIRILSTLLNNRHSDPTLFECDAFGLLVSLTFAMPSLFIHPDQKKADDDESENYVELSCQPPTGNRLDHHLLRLTYMYHLTQILLSNDFADFFKQSDAFTKKSPSTAEDVMETDADSASSPSSRFETRKEYIFGKIWQKAKKEDVPWDDMTKIDCDEVWKAVQEAAVPFLRCCAKFYESLTGISPSVELNTEGSSFDVLVKFLDLPKEFEDLFVSPADWQIPYKWASHPQTAKVLETGLPVNSRDYPIGLSTGELDVLPSLLNVKYPRKLPILHPLPDDYAELINSVSNFTCKNSKTLDSRTPTMCLVCGEIICSQSYCCQREVKPNVLIGACMFHANHCGGGSGIFLRIRDCKLFLTHGQNRGCFFPPPFLDEYGEPDQGLRRGNPLKLSYEKYEAIKKIWIQHSIPEEIARTTEHSLAVPGTEWQYL